MTNRLPRRAALLGSAGLATAFAGGLAAPHVARAQGYKSEYKLTVVGNRPIPFSEGAFIWADLINERSQGRINVKVYPGSQLVGGDQTRELLALRQGVADMAVISSINIAPQVRDFALFQLPFLTPNFAALDALIASDIGTHMVRQLDQRDVVALAWGENGFREISNSKRPLRTPADLRGLKIRYAAGAIFHDIFTGMGANPVQMSFADLQPALTTGAVDGQENPINLFLAFKMDALAQRHLTVWNYVNDPIAFVVGKPVMATFSAADQQLLRDCAAEASKRQLALARRGLGIGGDRSSFEELARRNVAVAELSPEEKRAFAQATRPVFTKWAGQIGSDLAARAEAIVGRHA